MNKSELNDALDTVVDYGYQETANILTQRIIDLIPQHPEILTIESPWDLFKIKDFKCDDLGPTLSQAGWALAEAKMRHCNSI